VRGVQEHPHSRNYKGHGNTSFLPPIEKEEARDADSENERSYSRLHSQARQVRISRLGGAASVRRHNHRLN
jgi:hypothetical protein